MDHRVSDVRDVPPRRLRHQAVANALRLVASSARGEGTGEECDHPRVVFRLEGRLVFVDGGFGHAHDVAGHIEVVPSHVEVRIESQRVSELRDGLVEASRVGKADAQVGVDDG